MDYNTVGPGKNTPGTKSQCFRPKNNVTVTKKGTCAKTN